MNRTNFEHALIALLMQLPFGIFGYWWIGAVFGSAFFLGREHAQAEELYLKINALKRIDVSLLELKVLISKEAWSLDALLDWIFPLISVVFIASIFSI